MISYFIDSDIIGTRWILKMVASGKKKVKFSSKFHRKFAENSQTLVHVSSISVLDVKSKPDDDVISDDMSKDISDIGGYTLSKW